MTAHGPLDEPGSILARVQSFAAIAAPTTLVAALLFYFGYVSTLVRYEYFGVDLNALDLSTTELLLLGTEVIFPPVAGLLVFLVLSLVAHRGVRALLRRRGARAPKAVGTLLAVVGAALFVRAVVGILVVSVSRDEFPGVTAISLGLGLPLLAYGIWVFRNADRRNASRNPGRRGTGRNATRPRRERARSGDVLLVTTLGAIVVLGLFWATNNFAAAYGRGRAAELAAELPTRPMVVLDLEQQLYLPEGIKGVHQFPLPNSEGQRFRVRCQGLRLLTEAGGRLFLVPDQWAGTRRTVVVPYDESVRVQFLPG
ncbi:hypothetical protein ADK67_33765 [Saccharothrix sp. NRRL B-16348]|uniref:hypothetical protein n=1 Tax=Saccharothrix sp. NRRL B-16348 TaxID=1415542 RepID=UPI0006AE8830|nr:hypothetical protein [Saccharothrix sp. NRRL B-16348]KOX19247.1 hypothetical protein ADK67_33765 [Saccharothrix sp. NRRL B-16348]